MHIESGKEFIAWKAAARLAEFDMNTAWKSNRNISKQLEIRADILA